jgi:hypothetical protein
VSISTGLLWLRIDTISFHHLESVCKGIGYISGFQTLGRWVTPKAPRIHIASQQVLFPQLALHFMCSSHRCEPRFFKIFVRIMMSRIWIQLQLLLGLHTFFLSLCILSFDWAYKYNCWHVGSPETFWRQVESWKPLGCRRYENKYKLLHTKHEPETSGDFLCEHISSIKGGAISFN